MRNRDAFLKPQDVVILAKLIASRDKPFKLLQLATELGISSSEVSNGVRRLRFAKLLEADLRTPLKANALEFFIHALKYVFPARLEALQRGVPTAHSASPLREKIRSDDNDQYVWADDTGTVRGQPIVPLYPSVPNAARKDPELHKILALLDSIRVGRVREQQLAKEELERSVYNE